MNPLAANALRFILSFTGHALVLHFCYAEARGPFDARAAKSYIVTCAILAGFSVIGWLARSRASISKEVGSSVLVASCITFAIIFITGGYGPVDGYPWQYFYADDYWYVFILVAPVTAAVLTGALCFIPERGQPQT